MAYRTRRIVGSVRERAGARRRRSLAKWQTMPQPAAAGSSWWAEESVWFPQGAPPRCEGMAEILIDGRESFRAMWLAIQQARHSVWLVDWAMNIDMELVRGTDQRAVEPARGRNGPGYTVRDLLVDAARRVDVRVLVWNGSLLFRPRALVARREMRRLRKDASGLRASTDSHIGFTHCHHQKTLVVDGRVAFVGGLDMTNFDTDRWDTNAHTPRTGLNWHDLCVRLEGPAAMDVARNFVQRWEGASGESIELPPESGQWAVKSSGPTANEADCFPNCSLQVVRTIPPKIYDWAPDGECGIAWAYRQAIRAARSFIYLENQYLWSQAVTDELIAALRRVQDPGFRVVLILPARPNIGKGDTDRAARMLLDADGGRGRVRLFTLYTCGPDEQKGWLFKPIYVHAKTAIIDDRWATVGSANLNGRGLQSDSEINVQIVDTRFARRLRMRLWSEHLGLPVRTLETLTPTQAIDQLWVPIAGNGTSMIRQRTGPLPAMAVPYQVGQMPRDLAIGELQAHLLDA